ncbi:MAG: hypothetical protein AB8G22_01500 [Saprospiraceae bacterium]
MIIISDTSPISNLLQINHLWLLKELYQEIIIPPAVQRELYAIAIQEEKIGVLDWIKVVAPTNQKLILELTADLDLGESESIALALEFKADYLIIDEYLGRTIAQ